MDQTTKRKLAAPTRRDLALGAVAAGIVGGAASASDDGRQAADRLVRAMGGATAWNRVRGFRIAARHYESDLAEPYDNLILMALDSPRMRFEGRSATMDRVRVIDGVRGMKRSEVLPAIAPMTAEQVRFDLDWWEAHAYRNVWRLARRDPTLQPRVSGDGRLELYRPDGSRLMWYRLNAAGEPVAFATGAQEHGVVLGPLGERAGGLKSPIWTTRFDGTFRVLTVEWVGLETVKGIDFQTP